MIRAQHARDRKTRRRNKRPKTAADLRGLRDYFDDENHPNHEGVRIMRSKPWLTTMEAFVPDVVKAAALYQIAAYGVSGRRWSGDIAEHVIAAPDKGSDLSDAEIEQLALRILERISPRSPAIWAAHFEEKTKTWEIHFGLSSFTDEPEPQLRVTDLRRREGTDYTLLLDESGFVALTELNQQRWMDGLSPIRSLADIHAAKIASVVDVLSRHEEGAGLAPTFRELLAMFQGSSWSPLKHTKTSVSLVSAEFSTPLHVRWAVLRKALSRRTRDKFARDGRDRSSISKPGVRER